MTAPDLATSREEKTY